MLSEVGRGGCVHDQRSKMSKKYISRFVKFPSHDSTDMIQKQAIDINDSWSFNYIRSHDYKQYE